MDRSAHPPTPPSNCRSSTFGRTLVRLSQLDKSTRRQLDNSELIGKIDRHFDVLSCKRMQCESATGAGASCALSEMVNSIDRELNQAIACANATREEVLGERIKCRDSYALYAISASKLTVAKDIHWKLEVRLCCRVRL